MEQEDDIEAVRQRERLEGSEVWMGRRMSGFRSSGEGQSQR